MGEKCDGAGNDIPVHSAVGLIFKRPGESQSSSELGSAAAPAVVRRAEQCCTRSNRRRHGSRRAPGKRDDCFAVRSNLPANVTRQPNGLRELFRQICHCHFGKHAALPEDSPDSTTPGMVRHAGASVAPFPLTPALSLGERVNPSLPGEQSTRLGFPLGNARCSLSPRERVRVRGKKPPRRTRRMSPPARATIARTSL